MIEKFKNFVVRKRITLSFLFAIFFVMFVSPPSVLFFIIGLEAVILGEVVRLWASGYLRKGEMLAVNGPYAYVRHPLYLGNFLIGTGFCIAGQSLNFFIIFLLIFGIVYKYTVDYENEEIGKKFKVEFAEYRESVPLFFPLFVPYKTNVISKFSWEQVLKNKEYRSCIGILIVTIILSIKLYLLYK